MRFLRTLSIGISFFSASPAIQKNIFIQNTRFINSSIIRYGRYAIGARISKGSFLQHKRVHLRKRDCSLKVSRIYISNVLRRSFFPCTSSAVDGLFFINSSSYIVLHDYYIHHFYIRNELTCILSFIMHSSFTRFQIANRLVTCFRSNALFTLFLFSRTAIRYYEVPIENGFSLRTTAIRFHARSVITLLAVNTTSTRIARIKQINPATSLKRSELFLKSRSRSRSRSISRSISRSKSKSRSRSIYRSRSVRASAARYRRTLKLTLPAAEKAKDRKHSFYESSIIEINKIAVLGKRVFRNATSSRKVKFSLSGSYIDELFTSTLSDFARKSSSRRTYLFRRSRKILRKIVRRKYLFLRFPKRGNISSLRSNLLSITKSATRPAILSVHKQRLTKQILTFFYSIVLRGKVTLRMREKYPFDTWVRRAHRHGIYLHSSNNNIPIRRLWNRFIFYKVTRSLIRNLRTFVARHTSRARPVKRTRNRKLFATFNSRNIKKRFFIRNKKYKSQSRRFFIRNKKYNSQSRRSLWNTSERNYNITSYSHKCNYPFFSAYMRCSFDSVLSFLSDRSFTSSRQCLFLHLFFLSTRFSYSSVDVTELRIVYQSIDKIDMCIRTIFNLSGRNIIDYQELCQKYKDVLSNNFLFHYRPFLSDLYNRTLLRVPSDVGIEVLSNLPLQYMSVLRRMCYSTAKLNRYKRFLVRKGILKIPTFSFLDGFFSCYKDVTWKTRAFFSTVNLIKNTTLKRIPHGFSFNQYSATYLRIFYLFLYSYLFLRKKQQCHILSTLSRISLFSGYSLHFSNCFTCKLTSTVFLYSFLDRIPSLYKTRSWQSVSTHNNLKRDYLNIRPFFHGDSIVFIKHLSHGIKRIPFICNITGSSATYYGPFCSVLFSNLSPLRIDFNSVATRTIRRTAFIRNRLWSQAAQVTQFTRLWEYEDESLSRFSPLAVIKKSRKYFSLSRRRYQKKWYFV